MLADKPALVSIAVDAHAFRQRSVPASCAPANAVTSA
jgi:hypothetical protein